MRKPYCSSASTVALRTSGCTFPRLFVDHWLVRSTYSLPSTSTRVEPFAPARITLARRVSSDQKCFGMSSRYRFQYRADAPFESTAAAFRFATVLLTEGRGNPQLRFP